MRRINARSRESHGQNQNQEGTWAISYGDMITLLLAFFILFFSIEPPVAKKGLLNDAMMASFAGMDPQQISNTVHGLAARAPEQTRLDASDHAQQTDASLTDKMKGLLSVASQILGLSGKEDQIDETKVQIGNEKDLQQRSGTRPIAKESISVNAKVVPVAIKALGAEIQVANDKIYITFPEVSFFDSASTDITKHGLEVLQKFTETYVPFSGKTILNIVGFSDPRPVRSHYRFRDNLELSVLRAVSAQRVLEEYGIPLARTRLMGHGVKKSLEPNETTDSEIAKLALSRKIMLIIEADEGSL